MRFGEWFASVLFGACLCAGTSAMSAPFHVVQADPIKGQDVMGDKSRDNTDGFVQAPIPRTQGSSQNSPTENDPNKRMNSENRPGAVTGNNLPRRPRPGNAGRAAKHEVRCFNPPEQSMRPTVEMPPRPNFAGDHA